MFVKKFYIKFLLLLKKKAIHFHFTQAEWMNTDNSLDFLNQTSEHFLRLILSLFLIKEKKYTMTYF
jgi:hypothetical protein